MGGVNYWKGNFVDFFLLKNELRVTVAHPYIVNEIEKLKCKSILDFGCGQADLLSAFKTTKLIEYTGYDPSIDCIQKASEKFKSYSEISFTSSIESIDKKFDAVILCFVIVTIDNLIEARETIATARSFLKPNGRVLILDTHPCFQDQVFSTLETDMDMCNYNKPFYPINVSLFNNSNNHDKKNISFTDYHKSLSDISCLLSSESLCITKIDEIYDVINEQQVNSRTMKKLCATLPPFLYIEGKKI
jgi:ubiquinone/menaquinone biosynthesis C-methylase UbiE